MITSHEHTGTGLWWRRGTEDHWHFQQMLVKQRGQAIAAARREGYLPRDAEVVATEATYTIRQQAAYNPHPPSMGLEPKGLFGGFYFMTE